MKQIIKAFVPEKHIKSLKSIWYQVKRIEAKLQENTLFIATRSRFLSSLYYVLISGQFGRENRAVLYGQWKYYQNTKTKSVIQSQYCLRRNIHRLEKGICMRNRRKIFATSYIYETVKSYELEVLNRAKNNTNSLEITDELKWAHDVLENYFEVVGSHSTINKSKKIFQSLSVLISNEKKRIPYKRDLDTPLPVSYDNLLALSHKRRSVRWYLPKNVPRECIDQAILVATQSPSSCNRQPFEFRVFDEPDLVKKISSLPLGARDFYHNFPAVIVVIGKLRAYFSERERHVIYIDAGLASMSLLYALETLGLSSCTLNWPDIEESEKEMSALLNLDLDERVILLISVGYPDPDAMVPYSQKKELDLLRSYNCVSKSTIDV